MKRRLTKAYDHMIMPDRCAAGIERKLQEGIMPQKTGQYTKMVSPYSARKDRRHFAAVAACLLLIMFTGSGMLYFSSPETVEKRPTEAVDFMEEHDVPEDHYAVATKLPSEQVEAFAKVVRHNMLQKNWEAMENKVHFPLTVQDQEIQDWKGFLEWMNAFSLYSSCWKQLEQESCEAMFCNWQGICMAEGFIWFNEVEGKLKITAINMQPQDEILQEGPPKQVPEQFADVLSGKEVRFWGIRENLTLEEYCISLWDDANMGDFTVVDMDADGICEIVVSAQAEDRNDCHLVLRLEEQEICPYSFGPGELYDLKKDGSFFRRDRDYRLVFNGKGYYQMMEAEDQNEKPAVQWHEYPCTQPQLLLRSYEYVTGTGWPMLPGYHYSYFESLLQKRAGNDWDMLKQHLLQTGLAEEDSVCIFDPDAPGTVMYGTVTSVNGFEQLETLGFYIGNEHGELQAEVRNFHTDHPEYLVGTHLEQLDSHGRKVSTPEEIISYFGFTPMPDGKTQKELNSIKSLIDEFAQAYLAGDVKSMKTCLADDYQGSVEGFPYNVEAKLLSYGYLPDVFTEEQIYHVGAGIRQLGGNRSWWFTLELVKQKNEWKVSAYQISEG